jgi:hypothetical protein
MLLASVREERLRERERKAGCSTSVGWRAAARVLEETHEGQLKVVRGRGVRTANQARFTLTR